MKKLPSKDKIHDVCLDHLLINSTLQFQLPPIFITMFFQRTLIELEKLFLCMKKTHNHVELVLDNCKTNFNNLFCHRTHVYANLCDCISF